MARAWVESTALGIYDLCVDGTRVTDDYFSPGFTSYRHQIQYQTHEVAGLAPGTHTLSATVGGEWAVGSLTYRRKSRISADRQAFLCELHIDYEDGSSDLVVTDQDWRATQDGPYRMAEWYDGETVDARRSLDDVHWRPVSLTRPRHDPLLLADYGAPVRVQEERAVVTWTRAATGEWIADFGQNFAGVVHARLRGHDGQVVTFRHAEVLVDGELFVKSLRTAKASATYTCVEGEQEYSPRLTYMGFRYVGVSGIDPEDLELTALVLHSDIGTTGHFSCSDDDINRLHDAIVWGGRSNFVDIPTDCPQRDERQGWTGDLAVFARTACYSFDMSRFLDKWLRDLSSEQGRGGGIPMVVPRGGDTWPKLATSCWGDSCILVPWAEYLARGDLDLLRRQYPTMKRFLKAALWWSRLISVRPSRRLVWRFPFHFGDWTAPGETMKEWLGKSKWIATAYLANSSALVARIATLLGKDGDAAYYADLSRRVADAYRTVFTDGRGTLKKEFQAGYVLPLHFRMVQGQEERTMVDNLVRLIDEAGGHLATGFPATPYILFALSDHGRLDAAYDLLLQTSCPSWLHMVRAGSTTIWERWDALREDGTVNTGSLSGDTDDSADGGMVSFNQLRRRRRGGLDAPSDRGHRARRGRLPHLPRGTPSRRRDHLGRRRRGDPLRAHRRALAGPGRGLRAACRGARVHAVHGGPARRVERGAAHRFPRPHVRVGAARGGLIRRSRGGRVRPSTPAPRSGPECRGPHGRRGRP